MAWWDINLHVGEDISNAWNKAANTVKTLAYETTNIGKNVSNTGQGWGNLASNILLPGWSYAGQPGIVDQMKGIILPQAANANNTSTSGVDTPVTETEPSLTIQDPNDPSNIGEANILLRRRKLQSAMKYGFASTVKHYLGNITKTAAAISYQKAPTGKPPASDGRFHGA